MNQMVIGGGTYAKSLKNIIALDRKNWEWIIIFTAPMNYSCFEMEEAVLIYMEAIKNLLAI